jgi:acyl-coenzyme A thioesterase PaaI-like protein
MTTQPGESSGSPALPTSPEATMHALCQREHRHSFSCRTREQGGLGLIFRLDGDTVCATWTGGDHLESYTGILHGGILATVIDSAMVHAIFARGVVAKTGHFELRYRESVRSGVPVEIRASIVEHRHPLYVTQASISQDGKTCVTAKAKFMAIDTAAG